MVQQWAFAGPGNHKVNFNPMITKGLKVENSVHREMFEREPSSRTNRPAKLTNLPIEDYPIIAETRKDLFADSHSKTHVKNRLKLEKAALEKELRELNRIAEHTE